MPQRNTDPRFVRVRQRLADAIVELAESSSIDDVTVSELTKKAGVSRTTFYKHGTSPAQFYADILIEPLEPHLARLVEIMRSPGEGYLLQWRGIYIDLLEVVETNPAPYERLFLNDGHMSAIGHFTSKLAVYFGAYVDEYRKHLEDPKVSALWVEMAASQQVYNFVSIVIAWLRTGMADSADVVVNTYLSLAPPWQLARFADDGTTSMRRSRLISELAAGGFAGR